MRIVMFDLDTLRPDHMGCYGYERNTTPFLDSIANEGCRFNHYHCSDAPCLPSRAALITGKFGIHNGVVGHGGTASDLHLYGPERSFRNQELENGFFNIFRKAGYRTASISSFAERHSAYWFHAGLNESYNCGQCGVESAEEVMPVILDWINRNADEDNWFLHINLWDAHTPYRAPDDFGNPFENEPFPNWITEEIFEEHLKHVGPHSINEINMYSGDQDPKYQRQPGSITEYSELRKIMDGYDCGIRYMDGKIGEILNLLKEKGIYDDVAFIITSDHGEDMGELGIYAEHGVADMHVTRIPMILKFPGVEKKVDDDLHYNIDILPTLADYFGLEKSSEWDGESYYASLMNQDYTKRPYLVVSQCAHVCQRSVIFDNYLYMRTYHGGWHLFPKEMLFDLENDYYQTTDIAKDNPSVCDKACRLLQEWHDDMMKGASVIEDPLYTVLREGGPFHAKNCKDMYIERLRKTNRCEGADQLLAMYPDYK